MTELKFDELRLFIETLGNGYIAKSGSTLNWAKNWASSLQNSYEPFKDRLKKAHTRNPQELLDRHKVGAAVLRSLCLVKPLVPAVSGPIPPRYAHVNFRLAFHTAIHVVRRYAQQDAKEAGDSVAEAMHQALFILPNPINDDGTYEDQTVKGLYEATQAEALDAFLLANILYLLDMYHRAAWRPEMSASGRCSR